MKIISRKFEPLICNGKSTNYIINRFGVIKSLNYKGTGKIKKMKQFPHKGYRAVNITIDGKLKRSLVHRLVAETFIDNPNNFPDVNHNLITYNKGEKSVKSKITKKQAKKICKMLEDNIFTLDEIAELNSTTRGIVYNIKYGYTWTDISSKYKVTNHSVTPKRKVCKNKKTSEPLSREVMVLICEDIQNTVMSLKDIAKKYNTSKSKVETLRYGNAHADIVKNYDFSNRNVHKKHKKYGKE